MNFEINNLTVGYRRKLVLHQISMGVAEGKITALIGPNGAGKSTLIRAASGVIAPQSGSLHVNGYNLADLSPRERAKLISVVPQSRMLPWNFTVYRTVMLGRTPYIGWLGKTTSVDHERIQQSLELTGIIDLSDRLVGELSGGEQQRVLLARALAQDTPVILLDEPITHLDIRHQTHFLKMIRELARQKRIAVLIVLHDLNLASIFADEIALLSHGRLVSVGSPQQILTEQNLSEVYEVPVEVIPHPVYGTPLVLPDGEGSQSGFPTS